jgi:hypothetical protein
MRSQNRRAEDRAVGLARPEAGVRARILAMAALVAVLATGLLLPAHAVLAVDSGPGGIASIAATETSASPRLTSARPKPVGATAHCPESQGPTFACTTRPTEAHHRELSPADNKRPSVHPYSS